MDREEEASKLLQLGMARVKKKKLHNAIRLFMRLTNIFPDSDLADNAFYNMGFATNNSMSLPRLM